LAQRPNRAPTPRDVELARIVHRYGVLRYVGMGLGYGLVVAALWVPLQPVRHMVDALAGKNTRVSITLIATIAVSVSFVLGGTVVAYRVRYRSLQKEVVRLRARLREYEDARLGGTP